ncbi:unnamed protein product [Citrullus colocynthis]|uniref:Uncharacterized protein n=1 Tax=Citrullus colocynthis TaxID=252529 RepID=A0ABP0ZB66_9ROSI
MCKLIFYKEEKKENPKALIISLSLSLTCSQFSCKTHRVFKQRRVTTPPTICPPTAAEVSTTTSATCEFFFRRNAFQQLGASFFSNSASNIFPLPACFGLACD